MSHKIAHHLLDFAVVRSVIGCERTRHMTSKLLSTISPPLPDPERLLDPPLPACAKGRSVQILRVVVRLSLEIELPTDETDRFKSSGTIVIGLTST